MNVKNKASAILLVLTAAWVFSSGAICRASDAVAPICFTNELAAFTNGQAVVAALKRGDEPGRKQLRALIGSRVLFDGSAGSGNADLKIGKDILLEVEVSPPREVRPHARNWLAEVVGVLTGVDVEKRVIHIKARPEEWKAYAAD
jgi:hypothetical protein